MELQGWLYFKKRMSGLRPDTSRLRREAPVQRNTSFWPVPDLHAHLGQLLELVTAGEQVIGESNSVEDAAKVAMRDFASARPVPAAVYNRGKLRTDRFPAQIQAAEQRRGAGK